MFLLTSPVYKPKLQRHVKFNSLLLPKIGTKYFYINCNAVNLHKTNWKHSSFNFHNIVIMTSNIQKVLSLFTMKFHHCSCNRHDAFTSGLMCQWLYMLYQIKLLWDRKCCKLLTARRAINPKIMSHLVKTVSRDSRQCIRVRSWPKWIIS